MNEPSTHRRPDVIGPIVLNLVGVALLIAASVGVGGDEVTPQIPYVNLGVVGVIIAGAGNALHLFGLRRAIRDRGTGIVRHPRLVALSLDSKVLPA